MIQLIDYALNGLRLLIFLDFILSWTMQPDKTPRRQIMQITDPLYAPIRAMIKPESLGIDLSPMILLILISVMQRMLDRALSGGF